MPENESQNPNIQPDNNSIAFGRIRVGAMMGIFGLVQMATKLPA